MNKGKQAGAAAGPSTGNAEHRNKRAGRPDEARSLFCENEEEGGGGSNETSATMGAKGKDISLKQTLFHYEKLQKRQINRWWEVSSLDNYIEVGRVPRGLRILITPTYQNPHPKLLEDWSKLMAETCKNMLGLLSKYASIKLETIIKEIDKLKEELDKHPDQSESKIALEQMEVRLDKYETEIKQKKKSKFLRDKQDYASGRILTFGRRYDGAIKQFKQMGIMRQQEAASSESGSDIYSDVEDPQGGQGRDPLTFKPLEEYSFLQTKMTLRARPPERGREEDEEEAQAQEETNKEGRKKAQKTQCHMGEQRGRRNGNEGLATSPRGGNREKQLRILESKYIILLDTKNPFGINEDEELFVHIG